MSIGFTLWSGFGIEKKLASVETEVSQELGDLCLVDCPELNVQQVMSWFFPAVD